MDVKIYKEKTINAAIKKIKDDLGPDAVIVSTKRVPKNIRDPYNNNFFEVKAVASKDSKLLSVTKKLDKDIDYDSQVNAAGSLLDSNKIDSSSFNLDVIREELVNIKDILFLINQQGGLPELLQIHPECINIYTKLISAGISEKLVLKFMKQGGAFTNKSKNIISKNIIGEILSSFSVLDPFEDNKRQIAAFVGPTGVGKTTTIAKLAAELSLKRKKNIGIISIDSYRIGALEQLKTYAAIMSLPCLAAFSKEDLYVALKKMQNKDIVLIDTAGHSHLDIDRIKNFGNLFDEKLEIFCHLVLSVTTKNQDMQEAVENFSILNPKTYLFTKIDETKSCGNIIDQTDNMKMPISFITNGQKVPEDIMPATKKKILNFLLN